MPAHIELRLARELLSSVGEEIAFILIWFMYKLFLDSVPKDFSNACWALIFANSQTETGLIGLASNSKRAYTALIEFYV